MQEIRRNTIKKMLLERKSILISQLSEKLNVSEMTIHRDLDLLQSEGFLTKKRGGAILNDEDTSALGNYSYNFVKNLYVKEKQASDGKSGLRALGRQRDADI